MNDDQLQKITTLLDRLAQAEYWIRKYRCRGDARAEQGNGRSATEYHQMAAVERDKANTAMKELESLLGPDGSTAGPRLGVVVDLSGMDSLEDACFYGRHPLWARHVPRLQRAHDDWALDPRFVKLAPHYWPIYSSWLD